MKPSNRLINLLSLQLASLSLALSMAPAVADDAVPRSALSKNSDVSRMSGMNCSGVAGSPTKVILPLGKSAMLRLPGPVSNRTLGNPNVAQAMLVSPESLYLLGMTIGTTNMILQEKNGSCSVIDVEVTMDPEALMQTFRELFPDEKNIRITAAADSLVLSGVVTDALVVSQVVDLATAYVRRPATAGASQQEGMNLPIAPAGMQQQTANAAQAGARVINLLSVGSAQQVMLEVKIAEVSKTLIDKLGTGVQGSIGGGAWTYSILTQFLTGTLGGAAGAVRSTGTRFTLEAEKKDGLVKILAEPNVMAISGQEGSFLAGGKILIPVSQDAVSNRIVLEEKEFGVGLKFTPTVLSGGRINLKVSPEVSELSREGVGISNLSNTANTILPLITTRRSSTTIQLGDGESFAIGGLIKNNRTTNVKAFPILGELPLIGALFRSTDFQQDRTELVFVVTPRLIKPLPQKIALPTDGHIDPSRSELFLGGQLEGKATQKNNADSDSK
jgi:pilus assembly protein CpaC